jgi:hypothetical protein
MSNKRINKAYVRFDGTGRVIPGSLILNRFKPQVGNWKETPAYECCNFDPCMYFTIESIEAGSTFFWAVTASDSVDITITWGDGTIENFTINNGGTQSYNHTFSTVGLFSGTVCFSHPSRITVFRGDND